MKGHLAAALIGAAIGSSVAVILVERSEDRLAQALALQYREIFDAKFKADQAYRRTKSEDEADIGSWEWWCIGDGGKCFRYLDECTKRRGVALCTPTHIAYCGMGGSCLGTLDACRAIEEPRGRTCIGVR